VVIVFHNYDFGMPVLQIESAQGRLFMSFDVNRDEIDILYPRRSEYQVKRQAWDFNCH